MKHARSFHTASVLKDGKVLVAGGCGQKATELYDPSTGTWTITGNLTDARQFHTAFLLTDGKVLVAGGGVDRLLKSAELYDPATGTWHTTKSLQDARVMHTGSVLSDGKVLIAGGVREEAYDYVMSAEIYDPSTGKWTGAAGLQYPRVSSTSSVLSDGKVLLVGATLDSPLNGDSTDTAEFYDPSTDSWTLTSTLNNARQNQAASVLSNGKVLISGGYDEFCQSNVELYDPSTEHKVTVG
jgi:N-acetylneuraminic acid mutarotase